MTPDPQLTIETWHGPFHLTATGLTSERSALIGALRDTIAELPSASDMLPPAFGSARPRRSRSVENVAFEEETIQRQRDHERTMPRQDIPAGHQAPPPCPSHGTGPVRSGRNGWYCAAKDPAGSRGYCERRPGRAA